MFNRAKRDLQVIIAKGKKSSGYDQVLAKNVTSAAALGLQDLSLQFRKQQAEYLKSES